MSDLPSPCYSELSPPSTDGRIDFYFPPGSRLRVADYPRFHSFLRKHGRDDLSWKIDSCAQSARPLSCWDRLSHSVMVPISCGRRTCPDCGRRIMAHNVRRFSPIVDIWEAAEKAQGDYRVRFWTLTASHPRKVILKPIFEAFVAAIRSWWRLSHGNRSGHPDCGGLFSLEVGDSGNVHAHALIYGPFFKTTYSTRPTPIRRMWGVALHRVGLEGSILDCRAVSGQGSITETIAYPLDPEKRKNLDEELLANIELSLSGRHASKSKSGVEIIAIPATRRQWCAGSWYQKFDVPAVGFVCPHCFRDHHIEGMTTDPSRESINGKSYHRSWFVGHPERWQEWEEAIQVQREYRKIERPDLF